MATIITKNSQTASAVPSAASLSVGELAVNTADGKLYTEHTGGVVKEIIPSTVVDGGITTAKIADGAITSAKIADGTIATADLANSSVTVAKISATGTPSSTTFLRGDGSWQTAGGGVTSLNGQTGAITNTDLYAIGSYVAARPQNATNYANNATLAGSSLYTNNMTAYWWSPGSQWQGGAVTVNGVLINTGTWRCMSSASGDGNYGAMGLWVRIS